MSNRLQQARDTFGPQCYKTFEGALNAFIATECPQLGGLLTRKALVQAIAQLVTAHYPSSTHMAQGQVRWTAVHKDEKSSYGKTIAQSQLTPVVLIFEGKNVQTVCRETDHSPEAVLRYTTHFKQVLMCKSKGLDVAQTSFATKLSPRLIEEHLALIEEYRQRYANLPNGESSHLEAIFKNLDHNTNASHTNTQSTP